MAPSKDGTRLSRPQAAIPMVGTSTMSGRVTKSDATKDRKQRENKNERKGMDGKKKPVDFNTFLEKRMRNEGYQSAGLRAEARRFPLPEVENWQHIKLDSEFVFDKTLDLVFGSLLPKGPDDIDKSGLELEIEAYEQKTAAKKNFNTRGKRIYAEQKEERPEETALKRIHLCIRSLACDTKGDAELANRLMLAEVESRMERPALGQSKHYIITELDARNAKAEAKLQRRTAAMSTRTMNKVDYETE